MLQPTKSECIPAAVLFGAVFLLSAPAFGNEHDSHAGHEHHAQQQASPQGGADPHAQHKAMLQQKGYARSRQAYRIPDLHLTDMHNEKVFLPDLLGGSDPVMLNFIYTSCTTVCPVLSATFTQVQSRLGDDARRVKMVSISIDPEQDTPDRLRDYAERFHAGEGWTFLTGSLGDIVAVEKAFDAYRGDKMNHSPLTFVRTDSHSDWVRMEGFASAEDVVKEYHLRSAAR